MPRIISSTAAALGLLACLATPLTALAQASVASVNGFPVPQTWVDQVIRNNAAQGAKDTPQVRQAVRDELVGREVLAQEALRLKLDQTAESKAQMALLRQTHLVDLLLRQHAQKNPITEDTLKTEYDRQAKALREAGDVQEARVSQILVASEAVADTVLGQLKAGEPFDRLARTMSMDASKERGGDMGWVLPIRVAPTLGKVINDLPKGSTATSAVQSPAGWHILRVEDKRPFKLPGYEDSKNALRQVLAVQQRNAYVQQLRAGAKIELAK